MSRFSPLRESRAASAPPSGRGEQGNVYEQMIAHDCWACNSPMSRLRGSLRRLRMVLAVTFEHTCTRRSEHKNASVFRQELGNQPLIITKITKRTEKHNNESR